MTTVCNDFEIACALYGVVQNSNYDEPIYFKTNDPVIELFNYPTSGSNKHSFDFSKIRNSKYNLMCWREIVEESKRHMETIKPDYSLSFSIPHKIKSILSYRLQKYAFNKACFSGPDFKIYNQEPFIAVCKPLSEELKSSINLWDSNLSLVDCRAYTPENYKLLRSPQCKGIIAELDQWQALTHSFGYAYFTDILQVKPLFCSERKQPLGPLNALVIDISEGNDYIKNKRQMYEHFVKYNLDAGKFWSDYYAKTIREER